MIIVTVIQSNAIKELHTFKDNVFLAEQSFTALCKKLFTEANGFSESELSAMFKAWYFGNLEEDKGVQVNYI